MELVYWFGEFSIWLTSPAVIPWIGMIAAFVAAIAIEPRTLLKSPGKGFFRLIRITVIWVIVAWLLCSLAEYGTGDGSGKGEMDGSGAGKSNTPAPSITIADGNFPFGTSDEIDLIISFVSSPANKLVAQKFSCNLLFKDLDKKTTKIEIRAKDMSEFYELIGQQVSDTNKAKSLDDLTVLIKKSPFPGENVMRGVRNKIRTDFPNATVQVGE